MKIMIAAGGTGGHIYPAMALAESILKKNKENEVVFFGSSNRMESKVIPNAGYRFYGLEMSGTNGGVIAKAKSLFSLMKANKECKKILSKEKPDLCIGFGNYISVPFIRAAKSLHIPTMIHEQNSFAGKANRYLAKYVDGIVGCYESNLEQFPKEKTRLYGNPEATIASEVTWNPKELIEIGLDPNKPFVLFMMGSLGSSSVSKVIDEALPLFDTSYQFVVVSGVSNSYEFKTKSDDRIKIVPYVNGKNMLKGCKFAVLRAGATTMAEIGALGTPSILIPSPYVPNNHQYFNAMELVKHGGAKILEEKDLSCASLVKEVNDMIEHPKELEKISSIAYQLGKRDAANQMINWIEEVVNEA